MLGLEQSLQPLQPRVGIMSTPSPHRITQLLRAWGDGDSTALDQLTPLVHKRLHELAGFYMRGERPDHILQTTALINEAYLRLINWKSEGWKNRGHFYGVLARLMRTVLVDFARHGNYAKRGGDLARVSFQRAISVSRDRSTDFVALDDALDNLTKLDPRKAHVVELRFYCGLSVEETAATLGVSPRTVMHEWSLAKAWLYQELTQGHDES